ncbi:MAG: NAD(P)/FAD-dependent oxidoreductase [Lachnospiraceae bacterium]|nr:NAD(P)/FAD-dependent oxidoreductase [Lachnospiraceae bacterium]
MYDCIIIGASVAGISAAINLKIRKKDFLLIGSKEFSAKVQKAELIQNYVGMPSLSGCELSDALEKHLEDMEIAITEARVNSIIRMGDKFMLSAGSDMYETKSVILATGVEFSKKIEGEDAFLGNGVSYCATCDGFFYRGRTIAVVGSSREAEKELDYLAELAGSVYYFPLYRIEADTQLRENVTVVTDRPVELVGEERVNGIVDKKDHTWTIDGVFFLKDALVPSTLLKGLEDDGMHIVVDRQMQTSVPGVFACGDCTGRPYQYMKAAGEGNIAAHSVVEFLAK